MEPCRRAGGRTVSFPPLDNFLWGGRRSEQLFMAGATFELETSPPPHTCFFTHNETIANRPQPILSTAAPPHYDVLSVFETCTTSPPHNMPDVEADAS